MSDTTQSTDDATRTEASGQRTTDVTSVDLDATRVQYGERVEEHGPAVRPDPYAQYGNLDTTGESLVSHGLNAISPVFAEGRVQALETAARALNPDDPTPQELVILPEATVTVAGSSRTPDEARADIVGQLNRLADQPVVVGASDRAAAEGVAPEDVEEPTDEQVAQERGQEPGRIAGTAGAPRTDQPVTSTQEQATGQPPANNEGSATSTTTTTGGTTTTAAKASGGTRSSASKK